jgi:hypothetical protein
MSNVTRTEAFFNGEQFDIDPADATPKEIKCYLEGLYPDIKNATHEESIEDGVRRITFTMERGRDGKLQIVTVVIKGSELVVIPSETL